jgi:hypothetical protein
MACGILAYLINMRKFDRRQHKLATDKYDKQDQQGKTAFNERNPHMTKQQEPMARSPGGPQT